MVFLLLICELYLQTPFKYPKMAEEDAVCPSLGEIAGWVIFAFLTQERSRHHLYVHIWMSDESIPFCVHLPFMQQTTFFFFSIFAYKACSLYTGGC